MSTSVGCTIQTIFTTVKIVWRTMDFLDGQKHGSHAANSTAGWLSIVKTSKIKSSLIRADLKKEGNKHEYEERDQENVK